jgi:formate dehydrogenase iron-sulfur subunit
MTVDKNRRSLLKGGFLGALMAMLQSPEKAGAHRIEKYPDSMGVLVDLTRCVGCRSCEAACNKEQGLPVPPEPFTDTIGL